MKIILCIIFFTSIGFSGEDHAPKNFIASVQELPDCPEWCKEPQHMYSLYVFGELAAQTFSRIRNGMDSKELYLNNPSHFQRMPDNTLRYIGSPENGAIIGLSAGDTFNLGQILYMFLQYRIYYAIQNCYDRSKISDSYAETREFLEDSISLFEGEGDFLARPLIDSNIYGELPWLIYAEECQAKQELDLRAQREARIRADEIERQQRDVQMRAQFKTSRAPPVLCPPNLPDKYYPPVKIILIGSEFPSENTDGDITDEYIEQKRLYMGKYPFAYMLLYYMTADNRIDRVIFPPLLETLKLLFIRLGKDPQIDLAIPEMGYIPSLSQLTNIKLFIQAVKDIRSILPKQSKITIISDTQLGTELHQYLGQFHMTTATSSSSHLIFSLSQPFNPVIHPESLYSSLPMDVIVHQVAGNIKALHPLPSEIDIISTQSVSDLTAFILQMLLELRPWIFPKHDPTNPYHCVNIKFNIFSEEFEALPSDIRVKVDEIKLGNERKYTTTMKTNPSLMLSTDEDKILDISITRTLVSRSKSG
jgi:hypothetical protein